MAETLASLAAQTYPALEVIIVDDGSTDRTSEIARQAADQSGGRMRYLRQENAGQAAALNAGWRDATGDYLGYLSADDVLYPDAIATLAAQLDATASVLAVYPDYDLIDAKSKILRRVQAPDFDLREMVERSVCQPGPGVLFRRDALAQTGGWNVDLRQVPDFEFWLRLSSRGAFARVPRALAGFRVHDGSQTFAAPSAAKSEEPASVMAAFLAGGGKDRWDAARAMAWAHVLSARLHLRGGRLTPMARHLRAAWRQDKSVAVELRFWHLLASGALGRLRYRLMGSTAKQS